MKKNQEIYFKISEITVFSVLTNLACIQKYTYELYINNQMIFAPGYDTKQTKAPKSNSIHMIQNEATIY